MDSPPPEAGTETAGQSSPPGKRAQTKQRNRHIILQAAKQVFASIGFEAATVRDIIHATPLASGTFYNYFKSKDDIYRAIYDEVAKNVRPQVCARRRQAKTADEFIRESIRIYFRYIDQEWRDFYRLRNNTETLRIRFEVAEVIAAFADLRTDIVTAIEKGILPPTDVDYLTTSLIGLCQEMAGELLRRPDGDPDKATDFVSQFILHGICALPPPENPAAGAPADSQSTQNTTSES